MNLSFSELEYRIMVCIKYPHQSVFPSQHTVVPCIAFTAHCCALYCLHSTLLYLVLPSQHTVVPCIAFTAHCCTLYYLHSTLLYLVLPLQLTGRHIVRDVSCKSCGTRLGWIYVSMPCFCIQDCIMLLHNLVSRNLPLKSPRDIR